MATRVSTLASGWCHSARVTNSAAISSDSQPSQVRRRSVPGSRRPNMAGVNSEISDTPNATWPLLTRLKLWRSISRGPSHRPRSDRKAA